MFFKKLTKQRGILLLGILAIVAGLGAGVLMSRNTAPSVSYRFGEVARGRVATSVSASGNVRADQQANVSAQVSGMVNAVHVKQGDTITEGQPLYEIRNDDIDADVGAAYASYLESRQGLEQAHVALSEAEATRDVVHHDPASTQPQKSVASQQVDAARTGIRVAEQNKSVVWQRYENLQQQAARRTVRAPMAGTITSVAIKVGDQVGGGASRAASPSPSSSGDGRSSSTSSASASTADVVIQNNGSLKAFVSVNEADVANVKVGQKAAVTFSAFDDLRATGAVERLDMVGVDEQGLITYQAVIALDQVDPRLRPEMTLSASITTEAKDNVLHVPITAVKSRAGGQKYVEVMENNAPKAVTVQTGLASDTLIEVVGGLDEGQRIIVQTIQSDEAPAASPSQKGGAAPTSLPGTNAKGQ